MLIYYQCRFSMVMKSRMILRILVGRSGWKGCTYSLVACWPCDRWDGIPSPLVFFGPTWWTIKVKLKRNSCAKKLVSRCSWPATEFGWHESRLKIILLCIRIFSLHTIRRANFGSQFPAPTLSNISLLPLSILPNIRGSFSHFVAAILIPAIFTQNLTFPTADSFLATIYLWLLRPVQWPMIPTKILSSESLGSTFVLKWCRTERRYFRVRCDIRLWHRIEDRGKRIICVMARKWDRTLCVQRPHYSNVVNGFATCNQCLRMATIPFTFPWNELIHLIPAAQYFGRWPFTGHRA